MKTNRLKDQINPNEAKRNKTERNGTTCSLRCHATGIGHKSISEHKT